MIRARVACLQSLRQLCACWSRQEKYQLVHLGNQKLWAVGERIRQPASNSKSAFRGGTGGGITVTYNVFLSVQTRASLSSKLLLLCLISNTNSTVEFNSMGGLQLCCCFCCCCQL